MSKDSEDPPTVIATVAEAETQTRTEAKAKAETDQPDTQDKMMQYIAGILRILASIFFICATVFFHPDNADADALDKNGAFFMTGFVVFGAALAVELYMKRDKGPMIVGSIRVALLAAALLFIAGILIIYDGIVAFPGVLIAGSLILITGQVVELIATFGGEEENRIVMMISMVLAILGTLFFFLGAVFSIEDVLIPEDSRSGLWESSMERRAALFITGSVLYSVHAIAYLVDAFM